MTYTMIGPIADRSLNRRVLVIAQDDAIGAHEAVDIAPLDLVARDIPLPADDDNPRDTVPFEVYGAEVPPDDDDGFDLEALLWDD